MYFPEQLFGYIDLTVSNAWNVLIYIYSYPKHSVAKNIYQVYKIKHVFRMEMHACSKGNTVYVGEDSCVVKWTVDGLQKIVLYTNDWQTTMHFIGF